MKKTNYLYYLVFIVVSIIAFQFQLNLKLSYYVQQPLFLIDFQSLCTSLLIPGGFIDYTAKFFTELYAFNLWGPLSTIFIISLLLVAVHQLLAKSNASNLNKFILPAIWLSTTTLVFNYSFQIASLITLIASFTYASMWFKTFMHFKKAFALIASLLFSILSYIFLGGLGLMLTSGFTIVYILLSDFDKIKKTYLSAFIALVLLTLPRVFVNIFYNTLPLKIAYFSNYSLPLLWYILVLILVIAVYLTTKSSKPKVENSSKQQFIAFSFTCILILNIPYLSLNKIDTKAIEIDYYANNKEWDKVLIDIKPENLSDQKSVILYNRALLNTGQLLDNCFNIPQTYGIDGLYLNPLSDPSNLMLVSDLFFDVGFINESRHWCHEAYTLFDKQPRILKRLVETNIINGQYNTALKYIIPLKKSLVNREWAMNYERIVTQKVFIDDFPELAQKRAIIPDEDFFADQADLEGNLLNLLEQPNQNQMAFELLMAYYLLKHKMGDILNHLSTFKKYNYRYLPKHIQEAIAVYILQTKDNKLNMHDYQLANDEFTMINAYIKTSGLAKKGNEKAKSELISNFGDTYWYYMQYVSPLK